MNRIFIDGQAGTTGLQIHERLSVRTDIELIEIDPAERKNPDAKQSIIDQADVVVLCLPDDAAREAVRNTKTPIPVSSTRVPPIVSTLTGPMACRN